MPILTCFNHRFTPSWLMIFLSVLAISLLILLGFWQIHRADEKKAMIKASLRQKTKQPVRIDALKKLPAQYQKITATGHYLAPIFLLDNQHKQHQFGFHVLTPLLLANGNTILVDRGWISGDNTRRSFPKIKQIKEQVGLQGSIYFPSTNPWLLGPNSEKVNSDLFIIESIDIKLISHILQKKVYPFIIRLDEQEPYGFARDWPIVSMPPQKHLAYAVQWFAMALVVLVLFVALNLKKNDENKYI